MNHWQKHRMKFILLIMFIFPLAVSVKSYGEERNLYLLSDGISEMEIDCGAGFLKLKGVEGLDEIRVSADIIAGNKKGEELSEFIEENVELSLERHGNRAVLISRVRPSYFFFSFRGNLNNRIDLTVDVPGSMDIEIKDGSGDIEIDNINGAVDIDDGSGSVDIAEVKGEVDINDGSGDLKISNIDGKTVIHDGSGDLKIDNARGGMEIRDGSGSIDITDITGNMAINDGSGDIMIDRLIGDLEIEDGSGSIRATDIDGNVKIYDGSGSIYLDGVNRDVDIVESGSGGVEFKNIKGNVSGDL